MKIRVVILLPAKLTAYTVQLARRANKEVESLFFLDNKHFLPHITLCRLEVEEDSLENIKRELTSLLADQESIVLRTQAIELVSDSLSTEPVGDFAIYLDLKISLPLKKLRKQVFDCVKKYNQKAEYAKLLPFRPHVTLARFSSEAMARKASKALKFESIECKPAVVALTNSIQYGQVSKIIAKFRLE